MPILTYQKELCINQKTVLHFTVDIDSIEDLKATSLQIKEAYPRRAECNIIGWRSSWTTHNENLRLFNFTQHICEELKNYNFSLKPKNSWFAVYDIGDMAKEHDHGNIPYTGIIYLEIGSKQSPLMFKDTAMFFNPGDFILFPGDLVHYVPRTNERRIILAYNFEHSL